MATNDTESTKQRILDAALEEFSAKGIAGARVDSIAARANANKSLLYYYFGSKDELFREILGRPVAENVERLRGSVTGPKRLEQRAQGVHAPATEYVRLLGWEGLEADPSQPADEDLRRSFFRNWVESIEAEQQAGNLPDNLDASQLVLAEICLALGPLILPQLASLITGMPIDDPHFVEARREFLSELNRRIDRID